MKVMKRLFLLAVLLLFQVSTKAQIKGRGYVDHVDTDLVDSLGNIIITPSGGFPPYTYKWFPGNSTGKDLTNAYKNQYALRIKDSHNDSMKYKYNIGYKTKWAAFSGMVQQSDSLRCTGIFGWGTALSKNTFAESADMWFEIVLTSGVTFQQIGVLDSAFTFANSCNDIDFGVYIYASTFQQIINGSYAATVSYQPGDVFRFERIGSTINYRLNETLIWSSTNGDYLNKVWKLRAGVHSSSAPMVNVGCNTNLLGNTYFANYVKITPAIIACTDKDHPDGSITGSSNEGVMVTYTWQPGDVNNPTLGMKNKGTYRVLCQDYLNNTSYYSFPIDNKVKWTDFNGVREQQDTIINTGLYSWGSAISKNTLANGKDGYIDVVLTSFNTYEQIGFLDSAYSINDNLDIDMGFYKFPNSIQRLTNGTYYSLCAWNEGDIMRVERVGNTVNYRLNGNAIWTNTDPAYSQKKWKIKASVFSSGGPITNIGSSFIAPLEISVSKEHSEVNTNSGSAFISVSGGIPPYQVLWKDSLKANYRSDMVPGIYNITISDSTSIDTLMRKVAIGIKPAWQYNTNLRFTPDSAYKSNMDSLGLSIAGNMIDKNVDGWVEVKISSLDDDYAIGFVGDNQDVFTQTQTYINNFNTTNTTLTYSLMNMSVNNSLPYSSHVLNISTSYDKVNLIRLNSGTINLLFRNSSDLNTYPYQVGDVIRVGRNGSGSIYVAKNDVILYTHTINTMSQYLYPDIILNSGGTYARIIGTIKGGGVFDPVFILPNIHAVPQVKLDGGYYTPTSNRILFTVEGEYNTMNLKFNVYNKTHAVVLSNTTPNITSLINSTLHNLGDNRYALNVSSLAPGFYILEVINEKNEKLYLRFKVESSGIIVVNPNNPVGPVGPVNPN